MGKFSSFKEDQLLFENWRKYTNVRKPQIIKEDLEVVLTNEEASEMFGDDITKQLNEHDPEADPEAETSLKKRSYPGTEDETESTESARELAGMFLDGIPHYSGEDRDRLVDELSRLLEMGDVVPKLEEFMRELPQRDEPGVAHALGEVMEKDQPDQEAMRIIAMITGLDPVIQAQIRAGLASAVAG